VNQCGGVCPDPINTEPANTIFSPSRCEAFAPALPRDRFADVWSIDGQPVRGGPFRPSEPPSR
jgi:hypothetical protein